MPVTPLLDVVGNGARLPPLHMGGTCVKPGTVLGLTVIVMVAVGAHKPAVGVNVYVVVAVLLIAGLHVPVTPLLDVVGNAASAAPEQIGATWVKTGVVLGLTVIVILAVVAQAPAAGVNVYVVVAVLLIAGLQVPLIPLLDVVGNAASVAPEHIGATWVNVGVMTGFTVMVIVVLVAHCPAVGVKV